MGLSNVQHRVKNITSALDSAKRRTARLSAYLEEIAAQQAVVEQMVPVVVSTLRARCPHRGRDCRALASSDHAANLSGLILGCIEAGFLEANAHLAGPLQNLPDLRTSTPRLS